jgi:dihydrolipoamide dehydrogenase
MDDKFDVVVIGAGPAGYVAAIRCAQLGMKVACIDDWLDESGSPSPGGTCLNAGCIPSKVLLELSEDYAYMCDAAAHPGIMAADITLDIAKIQQDKQAVVSQLTSGVSTLLRANGVAAIPGQGSLLADKKIKLTTGDGKGEKIYMADNIIIATGSRPIDIPAARIDGNRIVDSQGALEFETVPARLGIIGAGVIGLEMGSVWSRFGAEVMLLEAQETFLPAADKDIAALALAEYKRQGLDIHTSACVTATEVTQDGVAVSYTESGDTKQLVVDRLVVAVGRRPYTDSLDPAESSLLIDEGGFIHVDENCLTNLPGVYAIGDVVQGPMLAHKGSAEGVAVAEHIAGKHSQVNYGTIPSIIYTEPEIAWTGQTEEKLKLSGVEYKTGSFPFSASGRARAMRKTSGMVKILSDQSNDEILGIHIIGAHASELIAEGVLAMEYRATAEDLAMTIHGHPTLAEAVHEAALAVNGEAIHKVNRKA